MGFKLCDKLYEKYPGLNILYIRSFDDDEEDLIKKYCDFINNPDEYLDEK